jgi:zinc protease
MIKKIALAVTLLLILVASLVAAEMTADDLVGKYMTALGGESGLRAMKSLTTKGTVFTQGMTADMKVSYVLPSKSYTEILMGGIPVQVIGSNGTDAWMKMPAGTFYLTGDDKADALRQSNMFPLLDYKKNGAVVKYLGEDMVKGAKALKLEYVGKGNDTVIYYLDATTFLPAKEKRKDATVSLSDYRKVGGIMLPYKMNIQSAAQSMMVTLDSVAVNPKIADSLFIMPKGALPIDSLKAMMQRQQGGGPGGGQ